MSMGGSVEFGLFMELSVPRPWTAESERQVYENALEQVRLADELGFDYVWAVEHHFLEEYSHSSAPDLFLTACAMQTRRIRVGHGIVACVPQYQSPIRVAERAAVLDILSGGRVEFGTGRSATWPELSGFGANPDETKKTWDEFVRVIPKMWTQERFSWQGRAFSMPERAVLPKPIQKPHPPMWVAVTSPGTETDAADRGLGCLGLAPGTFEESEAKVRQYRTRIRNCEPVGEVVNERVHTVNFLSCSTDQKQGRRGGLQVASSFSYMASQLLSAKEVVPTRSYPSEGLLPALRREAGGPGDAAKAFEGVTMGDPDDVAAAIRKWESIGYDGINFLLNFMEVLPQEYVLDSMRLFAKEVMPQFKQAPKAEPVVVGVD
jgi:alkanesulfonate monooxygenase SsuD/methylene tetrahydromethanopterin reductase-like flavin-dependent oxidoreductase (luciferase family)